MIYPYGKKDALLVIGGMILYHALVIALCLFWIYRFLVLTFDPGVFLLLAMFCVGTAVCDYLLHKVNGFGRFLVCYRCSRDGILYMKLGNKPKKIAWANIQAFGISGFTTSSYSPYVYFLTNWDKSYAPNERLALSECMIRFRLDKSIWKNNCECFPLDIAEKLEKAIVVQRDCYFRR